jgi:hypothetical protein
MYHYVNNVGIAGGAAAREAMAREPAARSWRVAFSRIERGAS